MPFISSIRKNYNTPEVSTESNSQLFDISGGDVVYTAGGYKIHVFTSVGAANLNIKPSAYAHATGLLTQSLRAEYLVIGGGGSGGEYGGAGGAGGYITGTTFLNAGDQPVSVGAGGSHPGVGNYSTLGNNGQNSNLGIITALGGGYGGTWNVGPTSGNPGGSGGGQVGHGGGGGGGAGGRGSDASGAPDSPGTQTNLAIGVGGQGWPGGRGYASPSNGGPGGPGLTSSITGTAVTRAGGGGGDGHNTTAGTGGPGGGGPGNGGPGPAGAVLGGRAGGGTPGTANTGGGAGGAQDPGDGAHSVGGSGIVVVRYAV
jgi:hypothetical protein